MSLKELITWQTIDGETSSAHGLNVTPQVQSIQFRFPFGGYVWNRPVAVTVQKDDQEQRIPIVNVTLATELFIYALATLLTVVLWRVSKRDVH